MKLSRIEFNLFYKHIKQAKTNGVSFTQVNVGVMIIISTLGSVVGFPF